MFVEIPKINRSNQKILVKVATLKGVKITT
jgi:hypothetical protein